jgi:hypothetical protein
VLPEGLRAAVLTVAIAGSLGLSGVASAQQGPPVAGYRGGEPAASDVTPSPVYVGPTLPSTSERGPERRGDFRVSADMPRTRLVWEHHVHVVVEPPPPETEIPYLRHGEYPYADGAPGYVLRGSVGPRDRLPGRLHAGQIAVDGGYEGKRRGRTSLSLRFAFWRLGIDTTLGSHVSGRTHSEGPLRSFLVVGSTNALFAPILRPRIMWWVGGGLAYAAQPPAPEANRPRLDAGPNLTSTVDLFVARPIVLSARGDLGMLGGTPVVAARGTVGFMLKNFELYAGYEARRFGDRLLQGPMIGARAWF